MRVLLRIRAHCRARALAIVALACITLAATHLAAASPAEDQKPLASAEPNAVPPGDGTKGGSGAGTESEAAKRRGLEITAAPTLGDLSLGAGFVAEFLVMIRNRSAESRAGTVEIAKAHDLRGQRRTTAGFTIAAGATIELDLPVRADLHLDSVVRVFDDADQLLFEQAFARSARTDTVLVDVDRASALGRYVADVPLASQMNPWLTPTPGSYGWLGPSAPTASAASTEVAVARALYDGATGEPLLPSHAAGYSRVAAVLIRSDELVALSARRLEALASWVLGGGTLAIVPTRVEDLRHDALVAMVGGAANRAEVFAETLRALTVAAPPAPPSSRATVPSDAPPSAKLRETLSGYGGGNLRPSAYGASAPYGLGEVHLLAFNPQRLPAVEEPFAHVRVLDLLRRANERQSSVLFPPGGVERFSDSVARALDPNETSRWSILVATLLLCVYAIAAGPLNFAYWRRRNRPLMALVALPLASAATFGLVVATGLAAKGCSGKARRLTLVEAGAGAEVGSARTWRSFFVTGSRALDVWAEQAASVVELARDEPGDDSPVTVEVRRDGLGLAGLELRPWETTLVREDRTVALAGGIAIVEPAPGELVVVNRTGRALRGALLATPIGDWFFASRMEDGARLSTTAMARVTPAFVPSSPLGRDVVPGHLRDELEAASAGLDSAWTALFAQVEPGRVTLPNGVPVLVAQLEGGEGKRGDSGLPLEADRLLVRVVGWGGDP